MRAAGSEGTSDLGSGRIVAPFSADLPSTIDFSSDWPSTCLCAARRVERRPPARHPRAAGPSSRSVRGPEPHPVPGGGSLGPEALLVGAIEDGLGMGSHVVVHKTVQHRTLAQELGEFPLRGTGDEGQPIRLDVSKARDRGDQRRAGPKTRCRHSHERVLGCRSSAAAPKVTRLPERACHQGSMKQWGSPSYPPTHRRGRTGAGAAHSRCRC